MWPSSPEESLRILKPYFDKFKIRSVLDIGAYQGNMTEEFLAIFPRAVVYAFEPQLESFSVLQSLQEISEGKIIPFNVALGNIDDEVEMFCFSGENYPSMPDGRSSHIVDFSNEFKKKHPSILNSNKEIVQMEKLDSIFGKSGIELSPDILIKIDAEGYEEEVIRGGKKLFSKCKFCFLEIYLISVFEKGTTFKGVTSLLNELGLFYAGNLSQALSKEDGICMIDALFIRK